ncbi:inosine-uridine preferring nucleoside hydrolase domain-containing protein [Ditylenchus destructor]|nr:inosine-uridine preferring nucleoside hydrolase domain-containing protein [Ditylenchus destructor]
MKKRLVIDTDGVSDDVRAVSLALQHPQAEVLALTCVNGCVSAEQAVANMARTIRANNRTNIPIYKGAELPLIGNGHVPLDESHIFGSDGIGNAPEDFPTVHEDDFKAHVPNKHAAVALLEIFEKNENTTLVCIGPLTNIALALKLNPRFAKMPEKMVIMGGNIHGAGNVRSQSTAEYNFSNDPEAAHIVFKEMQCPITLCPWETFLFTSSRKDIDFHAHLKLDVPLAKFFTTATKLGVVEMVKNDRQFSYCDEIAVSVALEPEKVIQEYKVMRASVELHGEYTRGQVAYDWMESLWSNSKDHPRLCQKRQPITIVTAIDCKHLDNMIFDTIHNSSKEVGLEKNLEKVVGTT